MHGKFPANHRFTGDYAYLHSLFLSAICDNLHNTLFLLNSTSKFFTYPTVLSTISRPSMVFLILKGMSFAIFCQFIWNVRHFFVYLQQEKFGAYEEISIILSSSGVFFLGHKFINTTAYSFIGCCLFAYACISIGILFVWEMNKDGDFINPFGSGPFGSSLF